MAPARSKRKASPSGPSSRPAKVSKKTNTSGRDAQLKDYTGDFSDTTFKQAKAYCKELELPGAYTVGHKAFVERLQKHYGGFKNGAESTSIQPDAGDEDEMAAGSRTLRGERKKSDIKKPTPAPKPNRSIGKAASTTGGRGTRTKPLPVTPLSTRILDRGSHYRILELKKMLESVRNLARIEGDPALDRFLELLTEAHGLMHDIAPDPLSPDNPQSASSLAETL